MARVEVELEDLKKLVKELFDEQVQKRAEIAVMNRPGNSHPEASFEFAHQVNLAKPEAEKATMLRFRELFACLEHGKNCADALSNFVG